MASMDKGSISATVLTVADSHNQDSFAEYILAKFANEDVGNVCRTDATLMKIRKSLGQNMRCKPGMREDVNPLEPALHYCGANANYRCGRFSTIVAHGEAFTNSGRVFQPIRIGPAIFSGSQSRSFYCVSH